MGIFTRSANVNSSLANWFNKFGWASMSVNMLTLTWFFWNKYSNAFWLIRVTGCFAVSALILGIEFAALAVVFEPDVLDEFIGQNKSDNSIANAINTAGMIAVCFLAGATFWYDWTINVDSFNLRVTNMDYQILAAVIVLISELFFWIANVCTLSASKSGSKRPASPSARKPAPKE